MSQEVPSLEEEEVFLEPEVQMEVSPQPLEEAGAEAAAS